MNEEQALVEAAEVGRENAAFLSQKMSNKVRIQRWPSPMGPVVGPSVIIMPILEVAESLADSGFMRGWIVEKIREHLSTGGVFTNRGESKQEYEPALSSNGHSLYLQVRSEYRLASEQEVLNYVDTQKFASATGYHISKRAQGKGYVLHYHEGAALIAKYDDLPKQAKTILDLLNGASRDNFTEASIQLLLTENQEALRTRQDPMKIFQYYRTRLIEEGHLEEVGSEE